MNRKIFAIAGILVCLSLVGAYLFRDKLPLIKENDTTMYENTRVGYSVSAPSSWVASLDEAYQRESIDEIIANYEDQIEAIRGITVSSYVFASNESLLECSGAGPGFDDCVAQAPAGAFTEVSVTYRSEKTIDEVVATDSGIFGSDMFTQSPLSVDGRKTFIWTFDSKGREYIFMDKNGLQYGVYQFIHAPEGSVEAVNYQEELNQLLESIRISR